MEDEPINGGETSDMQAEEDDLSRLQEQIRNLPVADHIIYMMQSLSALAVGRLGLGGEEPPRQDLGQARLAIDAFRALLEVVEKAMPGQAAAHRGMLSQLQLAFVAALEEPSPGEADAGASADEARGDEDEGDTPGGGSASQE